MQFLTNGQILEEIWELVQRKGNVLAAVAFWGHGSARQTGIRDKGNGEVKILCDLFSGACNPDEIDILRELNHVEVKTLDGMHAKVWVNGDMVIVGSANASTHGLGADYDNGGNQNVEAAVLIKDSGFAKNVQAWFNDQWRSEKATKVGNDELTRARHLWERRRQRQIQRPFSQPRYDLNFVDALRNGAFTGRRNEIYIAIDRYDICPNDRETINGYAQQMQNNHPDLQGLELDAWVDWPEIPRQEYIIDYFFENHQPIVYEGIWYSIPGEYDQGVQEENMRYQFAYRVNSSAIGMTGQQCDQLTNLIQYIVTDHVEELEQANEEMRLFNPEYGYCIRMECLLQPPFEEIVDEFLEQDMQ